MAGRLGGATKTKDRKLLFGKSEKYTHRHTLVQENPASDPSLRIIYYHVAYASFSHTHIFFAQYETEGGDDEEEEDTNNRLK